VSWLIVGSIVPGLMVSCAAAYVVRRRAAGWGLIDQPGHRKVHQNPTPLGGGLAIWLGVVLPLAAGQGVLWLVQSGWLQANDLPRFVRPHLDGLMAQSHRLWLLVLAGTVLMLLGLADDLKGLDWRFRLGVQVAVASVVVWQGWRITLFVDAPLLTGAITVMWIVALINSFNMLDNMDALSGGVATIAAAMLAGLVLAAPDAETGNPQLFVAGFLLVMVGAVLGFLWHNRPPARLFMGDAGSYFLGFWLALATIMASFTGGRLPTHAILAPLLILAVPLYDMLTVLWIRRREGRSLFVGDKSHFSHRLVKLGLTKGQAVLTIYLTTATCGLGAFLLHQVDTVGAAIVVLLVLCVLTLIAVLETAGRKGSDR
jgi:UDP-GlcNAc:undecaprenyl-phosphate/decaprenyl-phosphate GlcNAc-1-phosphate transferase